ncbi:MAG: nitrogenase component 1 [Phascolarctobacterium sp.]|nr:nitrogenase component 1 [Phascolarctobacterium sp.]
MQDFIRDNMILGMKPLAGVHRFSVNGKISGNLAAIHEIENAVPVIVSPIGCGFHYRNSARSRNTSFSELECVNMNNEDVIFGSEAKLKKLLRHIDQEQKPEIIFVLPSVVSDVINDDLEGVVLEMQKELKAKIIPVRSQVFSHMDKTNATKRLKEKAAQGCGAPSKKSGVDYKGCGYVEVMEALVDFVMEPQEVEPLTINVESFIWGFGGNHKLACMKKMFAKLGIKINVLLPACSLEDIKQAPRAALNIVRRKNWADKMQEKFGTPYLHIMDMMEWHGLNGITEFYLQIGKALGIEEKVRQLLAVERKNIEELYEEYRNKFASKNFCLFTGMLAGLPDMMKALEMDYGFSLKKICITLNPGFQKECGLDDKFMQLLYAKLDDAKKYIGSQADILLNPTGEEIKKAVASCDFIITGSDADKGKYGKTILPLYLDSSVFDYASFVENMKSFAKIIDAPEVVGEHLLLNRLTFDKVFFPLEANDENTHASREMYARMWRKRRL